MITLHISGEDAESVARALAQGLDELGAPATEAAPAPDARRTRDALMVATFVLSIPPAILACWDLGERIGKIEALQRWLGRVRPGTKVVVTNEANGRSTVVGAGDALTVIDIASKAAEQPAWDVFLAYAGPDAALALELYGAFKVRGLRTFIDRRELQPGERWDFALVNAQASARGTVVLVSPDSGAAWYEADEIQRAVHLQRNYQRFLIPLYRDGHPCDPTTVPYGLYHLVALDLPGCGGVEGAATRVRDLLRGNCEADADYPDAANQTPADVRHRRGDRGSEAPTWVPSLSGTTLRTESPLMSKIKVLLICANPRDADKLRLGEEDRTLRESIQLSTHRERFEVSTLNAATIDDLRRALLRQKYDIVQISGHGTRAGLVFEDTEGNCMVPDSAALADLLQRRGIKTVVLNACYSLTAGSFSAMGLDYTIAMEGPIADRSAIEFARGFYDALGEGLAMEDAYAEGVSNCRLKRLSLTTVLLRNGELNRLVTDVGQGDTGRATEERTITVTFYNVQCGQEWVVVMRPEDDLRVAETRFRAFVRDSGIKSDTVPPPTWAHRINFYGDSPSDVPLEPKTRLRDLSSVDTIRLNVSWSLEIRSDQ